MKYNKYFKELHPKSTNKKDRINLIINRDKNNNNLNNNKNNNIS